MKALAVGPMTNDITDMVRSALAGEPDIAEIRMMGGRCFMRQGNMVCGTMRDGSLLVRVGANAMTDAIEGGATPMVMGGRTMKDFAVVAPDRIDAAALRAWINRALAFVKPMPAKSKTGKSSTGASRRKAKPAG